MKHIIFFLLSLFSVFGSFAQGNILYHLRVMDDNLKPLKGIEVVAIEKYTSSKVLGVTDNLGLVSMELNNGKDWTIAVGEIVKALQVAAIPYNFIETNVKYIYNLERFKRIQAQSTDHSKGYKVIDVAYTASTSFQPPYCLLEISAIQPNGITLPNTDVDVVDVAKKTIYRGITNEDGQAYFVVPNNSKYDVDVNGLKNVSFHDFGDTFEHYKLAVQYSPTIVNEQIVNDTIFQNVTASSSPSSERALIKIDISGGKRNGVKEHIYLRELKTNKVYASTSYADGSAYFLVPIKSIYMVDFDYQKDVDAVNLSYASEMTTGAYQVFYSPDPRLEYPENYIPTSDRLLIKNFNSFLTKQFEKPKTAAFSLKLKSVLRINKESKEALFLMTLAGGESGTKRLPMNLAFVLDKSGSMYSSERSESLKKSLWKLGNLLSNSDNFSVVLFDDNAITIKKSSNDHLTKVKEVIEFYEPSGGTNIFEGIKMGAANVLENHTPNKANKVIVLTDGYGVTPPKEITDYVNSMHGQDISFSTIGLGTSYNQSLLELISKYGNGTFSHVDNSNSLSKTFLKEVENSFNFLAKDVTIDIYHDKKLVYSKLYGFPTKSLADGRVSFEIKKLSSDHNSIAYLKFKTDELTKEITDSPLTIKVSYFDMVQQKTITYEQLVPLEWTDETDTELLLEQEEKMLYAVAILNQSLKVMAQNFEVGNNTTAKEGLLSTKKQVEEIFPDAKPKEVKALLNDIDNYIFSFKQQEKNSVK